VAINNNCLAGNGNNGLFVGPYQRADATKNWWGSDTGPKHPANPAGTGDFVTGDGVALHPWLLAANCMAEIPQPPESLGQPPALELSPGDYPAFQINVLNDKGFDLFVRDEDGLRAADGTWKIDWARFRVRVDGNDVTGRFLEKLVAESVSVSHEAKVPVSAFLSADGKQLRLFFQPDSKKFMTEHNLFGIEENGESLVQFEICDFEGNCASSDRWLYFGPMVLLSDPVEALQLGFQVKNFVIANCGFASTSLSLYLVIQNLQTGAFKSLIEDAKANVVEWRSGIPAGAFHKDFQLSSAVCEKVPEFRLTYRGLTSDFLGIPLRFYMGVQDEVAGAASIDWADFTIPVGAVSLHQ